MPEINEEIEFKGHTLLKKSKKMKKNLIVEENFNKNEIVCIRERIKKKIQTFK